MKYSHKEAIDLLRTACQNLNKVGASRVDEAPDGEPFHTFWYKLMTARDGFEFRRILQEYVKSYPNTACEERNAGVR